MLSFIQERRTGLLDFLCGDEVKKGLKVLKCFYIALLSNALYLLITQDLSHCCGYTFYLVKLDFNR